jgi:flavocytochrome c
LVKHYSYDKHKFLKLSTSIVSKNNISSSLIQQQQQQQQQLERQPDAIVVGSGLAGMAATLNILDRGGRVILLEKEHLLGGNSNKASSGINACCPTNTSSQTDSIERFERDTLVSAAESARPDLVSQLVTNSARAVEWLRTRVGIDLSLTAQLGGHSDKRTHRPSNGMVGAEIIYGLQKAIKAYEKSGHVQIIVDAKVNKLLTTDRNDRVIGVEYIKTNDPDQISIHIHAPNVILATGGFAADRSAGSYLNQYRPELLKMPTTAGAFSTGDGVALATSLGAGVVDMDKVQVHPTGWVDPSDPDNTSKTLAAELLRGVGGILLNQAGRRFCNELGTRSYVTDKMLSHNEAYAKTGKWDIESPIPTFSLVLSSAAASGGTKKHVDLYTRKGLMNTLHGVSELAKWMNVSKSILVSSLNAYQKDASKGNDEFGKNHFPNVFAQNLEEEIFHAGTVTPVLHYCMGGLTIDTNGNVLSSETGQVIPGLHAAGEVTGGVHGVNRLAGNSLLECTVYGTIVGQKIPIQQHNNDVSSDVMHTERNDDPKRQLPTISMSELQQHNTPEDCWIAIHGVVYDMTEFADEHPAGAESIHELAGTDGTDAFDAVHNQGILDDFDDVRVGILS